MTLQDLNNLVFNFNDNNATIRVGKNWNMTIFSNSHTFMEVRNDECLRIRNDDLHLYIISIYHILDYKLEYEDIKTYRIYKEEEA